MAALTATKQPGKVPADAMPLKRAIRCIGGRCKPWGIILKALRVGDLPFWLSAKETRGDDRLEKFVARAWVRPAALAAYADATFSENEHQDFPSFSDKVSQLDTCDLLNIDFVQMQRLIASGGLNFEVEGKGSWAPKETALELARRMISPTEVCVRWGLHPSSVTKQMRQRVNVARVHVGWSRTDVEREMAGHKDDVLGNLQVRAKARRGRARPTVKTKFLDQPSSPSSPFAI